MNSASQKVGNPICPKCLTSHPVTWNCEMVFPDTRANRPADDGLVDAAKAIHAEHMIEKGPLAAWSWEEANKGFYERLARAAATALRAQSDAEVEREAICKWLRGLGYQAIMPGAYYADAIEAGDHLGGTDARTD